MNRDDERLDDDEDLPEEEDIYTEEGREEQIEEDELTDLDEGFMQGYEGGEKIAKCALCKRVLEDDFVEAEINGEMYRFCSDAHAEEYKKKQEKED